MLTGYLVYNMKNMYGFLTKLESDQCVTGCSAQVGDWGLGIGFGDWGLKREIAILGIGSM